jgi:hypothetical protein
VLESITLRTSTRRIIGKCRHRENLQNIVKGHDGLYGFNTGNYSHREHANKNVITRVHRQHCQHEIHYNHTSLMAGHCFYCAKLQE